MMQSHIGDTLDQVELLHLAMRASQEGNEGAAIAYLKDAVGRKDATAAAHLLLGAEYAQVKLFDRAITEMQIAVTMEPALSIARLELGMLCVATNDNVRAVEAFSVLSELAADDYFHWFGAGMLQLIENNTAEAFRLLSQAMIMNTNNPNLNATFANIIDSIGSENLTQQASASPGARSEVQLDSRLGAYFGINV